MGNWGISENATDKEKLKSELADYLNGLNSCGDISYSAYSEIFDFGMDLLDKMYELGKAEKQIPKAMIYKTMKIKDYESESYLCPVCKWNVECGDKYCKKCGQSISN